MAHLLMHIFKAQNVYAIRNYKCNILNIMTPSCLTSVFCENAGWNVLNVSLFISYP
jgi:hypothetical protein